MENPKNKKDYYTAEQRGQYLRDWRAKRKAIGLPKIHKPINLKEYLKTEKEKYGNNNNKQSNGYIHSSTVLLWDNLFLPF